MTVEYWEAAIVALGAAVLACQRTDLTWPAAIAAAVFGTLILRFGGWDWGAAIAGAFIVTTLLSRRLEKLQSGNNEFVKVPRTLRQLIANGLIPALLALMYPLTGSDHGLVAAYLGAVSAAAGDTWASSAAQFSNCKPRLLTSGQRVPVGTPGAVTVIGIVLTVLAGALAATLYLVTGMLNGIGIVPVCGVLLVAAAMTGALAGSLFDSYLGASRQAIYRQSDGRTTDNLNSGDSTDNTYIRGWRWLHNDLVNFANTVTGALSAYIIWLGAVTLRCV